MKKEKGNHFDWSRNPSREGVHSVYIASPNSYATYGRDITKEEMANSLAVWTGMQDLERKRLLFKRLFIFTLASIPFVVIIYNMIATIMRMNVK